MNLIDAYLYNKELMFNKEITKFRLFFRWDDTFFSKEKSVLFSELIEEFVEVLRDELL